MKFGVNYTPRVGWFHHWLDFNPSDVAQDFQTIAELGIDHVRVFPLWPVFQPNSSYLSPSAMQNLDTMIRIAADHGLEVAIDGLQGHLSSFDLLPSWIQTWHRRNMFTDPDVMAATANYLTALAELGAKHDNAFAITIGNEVSQFTGGLHPDPFPATSEDIDAWLDVMIAAIRTGAPDLLALNSSYDASWFESEQPFTLKHVAQSGDLSIVHSWVFNQTAQIYGPDAFETTALARYLIETARAFQTDSDRQIWLQEIGAPRNVLPLESIPAFIEKTIAQVETAANLYGITWWCSHDVSRSLADFPELEYTLGLIDSDGNVKPEGRMFQQAIALAKNATVRIPSAEISLDLTARGGRSALAPGGSFFNDYMTIARRGEHPTVVRANDDDDAVTLVTEMAPEAAHNA